MHLLRAQPVRDGILEQKLFDFASKHQSYLQYTLDYIAGNRGCHESSTCEQNHFSRLVFLNGGVQQGNTYMASPVDMISELMDR